MNSVQLASTRLADCKVSFTGRFDAGAGARAPFRNQARSTLRSQCHRRVDKVPSDCVESGNCNRRCASTNAGVGNAMRFGYRCNTIHGASSQPCAGHKWSEESPGWTVKCMLAYIVWYMRVVEGEICSCEERDKKYMDISRIRGLSHRYFARTLRSSGASQYAGADR